MQLKITMEKLVKYKKLSSTRLLKPYLQNKIFDMPNTKNDVTVKALVIRLACRPNSCSNQWMGAAD